MKVLTLNTHSWQEENQLEKLETLTHAILEQDFDVIALQEVNQHQSSALIHEPIPSNTGIKQGNYAYLLQKKLARLGAKYHLCWDYVHQSYDVYEEGLAFLTKAEILSHQTIDLSPDYDETFWKHRRASHIQIKHQGQLVDLFNCHCGWWDDDESPFQQQIKRLLDHVPQTPSLLLGDFNNPAHLRNQGYDFLLAQGLFDCFTQAKQKDEGYSVVKQIDGWDNNQQNLRIDLILSNQKMQVNQTNVIFNSDNYGIISDHFGVMSEILIPKITTRNAANLVYAHAG